MTQHRKKKLLDRVRDAIRAKHYSIRTEKSNREWCLLFPLYAKRCVALRKVALRKVDAPGLCFIRLLMYDDAATLIAARASSPPRHTRSTGPAPVPGRST